MGNQIMPNPTIRIHNTETNEVIDRPMTKEEFAEFKELIASVEKREEEEAAKQLSKEALLEKLGITAEEAALLLG
jgi:hypothetical protein